MVGETVYFKFQSFNIWGSGIQAISTCVAYSYAVLGSGVFIPAIISGFGAALTQDGAANGNTYTLAGQWTADPNSASYEVRFSRQLGLDLVDHLFRRRAAVFRSTASVTSPRCGSG